MIKNLRVYWNFLVVCWHILPTVIGFARDKRRYLLFGEEREVSSQTKRTRAKNIRDKMIHLGPTYIKLGQVMSARPDILPSEYTEVLSELQDDVPSSDWERVKKQLESELDGDIDNLYDRFDEAAISGASLGQVHIAELEGQKVAVKVRRPGIENRIETDIEVLKILKSIGVRFLDESRRFSVETFIDEFTETIEEEMDYDREKSQLRNIKKNFEDYEKLKIPKVFDEYSTDKILTMEYVDGIKIDNIEDIHRADIDKKKASRRIQEIYFRMIIKDGLFHADPHPGNISIKKDGTIVIYDFGMIGNIDKETRSNIVDFYLSITRDNYTRALDILVEMNILDGRANTDTMEEVLELAVMDARGDDIEQRKVEDLIENLEDELYSFPLRLPPNFSLLLRTATVANGVCLRLDPNIDFIDVISDLLKENGYVRESAFRIVKEEFETVKQSVRNIKDSPQEILDAVEKINEGDLEAKVEIETDNRHSYPNKEPSDLGISIIMASMVISATILYVSEIIAFIIPVSLFLGLSFLLIHQ